MSYIMLTRSCIHLRHIVREGQRDPYVYNLYGMRISMYYAKLNYVIKWSESPGLGGGGDYHRNSIIRDSSE